MTWPPVFVAFLVCHLTGDLLLQTEWQALTKVRSFSDREGRRALTAHVLTYTLPYLPVLVWVADDRSVGRAIVVALLIALPHMIIDDGRLVRVWLREVKHSADPAAHLRLMVDQSFHVVCLLGVAVLAAL
jgi:hypothetical protein